MPVSSSSTTPTLPYISPTNSNHVSKVASSLLPALPSSSDLLSITDIDVQRIVAVVNELITKFELLCSIPETIDKRAISMLGSEITDEIKLWNELKTCRDESSIERLHSTINEDVTQVEKELEKAKKERIAEINIKNEAIQKLKGMNGMLFAHKFRRSLSSLSLCPSSS
ncbi:hypothetical protein HMI54_011779 [Coelomomyces lativittatus]|nr:hypothetical protein HMI54_011779 [Coelomomyces lativittatus]